MAMKTAEQKAAEKAMWERIAAAFTEDAEVTALCETMLAKYAPTEAELFAYDLLERFEYMAGKGVYHSSKDWAELVGCDEPRKLTAAITRLVRDGKMLKIAANKDSRVCTYCVA